jgi:hypothetical protein
MSKPIVPGKGIGATQRAARTRENVGEGRDREKSLGSRLLHIA